MKKLVFYLFLVFNCNLFGAGSLPNITSKTLSGHTAPVYDAAYSPTGDIVVTASGDTTIKSWNPTTAALLKTMQATNSVSKVVYNHIGDKIASASAEGNVIIWDVRNGRAMFTMKRMHEGPINNLAFSADGTYVASAGSDNTIRVINANYGTVKYTLSGVDGHGGPVSSVAFSPDGKFLLSGGLDGSVIRWDLNSGKPQNRAYDFQGRPVYGVAFSPDGKKLAAVSEDKTARVYDVDNMGVANYTINHNDPVFNLAFTPDSTKLLTTAGGNIKITNVDDGALIKDLCCHFGKILGIKLNKDGTKAVTASEDTRLMVWELVLPYRSRALPGGGKVYAAAFSPDAKKIVSVSEDKTGKIWDMTTLGW